MARPEKNCLKRLMHDLEELTKSPVENVSAVPLEDNMLEWHCNIRQGEIIFHLILFFSPEYPSKSPSAEFVPRGFSYGAGATKHGRKGTQICLSIFSDFENVHVEWASDKNEGWSPGYTVQTILMNVISFLAENETTKGDNYCKNLRISQNFTCTDCGHSSSKPYPHLKAQAGDNKDDKAADIGNDHAKTAAEKHVIVDYYSKEKFTEKVPKSDEDLFGYGLIVSGPTGRAKLTTPCEFLTVRSFNEMKKTMGSARSVLKDELVYFLPLYIHPNHGSHIRDEFEKVMHDLSTGGIVSSSPLCMKSVSVENMVLKTLPNLMCAVIVHLFKEIKQTNEKSLNGYFALHRLFLWAIDTYPGLQEEVDKALKSFIEDEKRRTKTLCPDIGQWLMLLAASKQYRWQDAAKAYLSECSRRNVMWYVKDDALLGCGSTSQEYRLEQTFRRTSVSRNLLAFQVVFLDIALPANMTRDQIIQRYDENWGFPTESMLNKMKTECRKIHNEINTYADWYRILNLQVPTDEEIFKSLVDALTYASTTYGYKWRSY